MILSELTGDESLVDTPAPKREIAKPSADHYDWPDTSSGRRRVREFNLQESLCIRLFSLGGR